MSDFLTRVRTIRPDLAGVSDSELSGLLGLPYEEPARSFPRAVGDAATKLIGGVPKAAAGLVGLGSFVPGVHYAADPLAEGLNNAGNWVEDQLLSDVQKRKDQELSRVLQGQEGFWDDAKAAGSYLWDNPSQAAMTAIGSIPSMIAGGIAGKGIRGGLAAFGAKPISAATAAAAGEGAVIAGSVGSEIAARNPEDFAARYYGIPAGLAGAAIGRAGAKVMGGSDIDTMIVNGMTREALEAGGPLNLLQSLPKRVGLGVVGEGLVEEAPQSAVERMMTNLGVEAPMMQGVGAEAVIGGAAGGIMGGAAGLRRPGGTYTMQERDQALQVLSDPTASYGARVQAAEYLQRIQDDGRPRDLLNMQQEAEEQFVEQSATELADQIRAERMPSTEPEFQWQQPGQTKEDVAAAFDEVVGTVGDKPVTAWDAYKAAHPEIFAKQEKAPKEKKLSKRQQEMNTLMAEAAQAGATEQDMQLLEGMVKDFKLPELRKTVAQIKAARAETPNVPPPDPVEAVQRRAEAVQPDTAEPQEVTARQVLEGLIAKIPGKIQQRDVGQYFGLLTGVETDTAVMAERRGVSRQAANDSLKRGLASLRKIAEKSGVSLEALQRQISEENDTGLTVSQQEILDATQTSTLDDGDLGTSLTVKDNTKKSFGETRRYIDPEQAYRETMLRTNGDPNQANLARARAQANNAELAQLDAAEGPLEEPIVGQTLTPTYEHSAEDVAKAKQLWEELQAENGWVAWEVLSQEDKDSYTQMTRDILVGVMPNYSRLDKHADYLSEKYDGDSRQPERRTESPDDGARGPDLQEVQAANGEPDPQQGGEPAETEEVVQGDDRQGARGEISADLIEAEWDKGTEALGLPQWSRLSYSQQNYMLGSGTWQEFDEAAAEIAEDLTTGRIPADEAGFTTGQPLESQVSGRTKNPSTEKSVLAALYELAGVDATAKNAVPWNKQRLAVYGTLSEVPENLRHLFAYNNTQGVAWEGIRAVILAERVEKGTERGVLLHEVGAHVGLTELIGEKNVIEVANQIERMGKGGSRIEQEAVAAAQARIPQDTPQGDRVQELIGYTAEELDKRGIRPQGQGMGSQLLRKIMALVRTALNKLGLFQVGTEAFTGQDLMDLLQGSMANVMQGQRQFTTPPLSSVLKSGNVRPLWYSRAAEHVLKKGPGKATAAVWMSNLNSWAKSGAIKQDELQWSGVENWLKGQEGTLSRDDVARFFNEGGVQVEEKVLGGGSTWLVYERGSGNVLAEGFNTESDAENWATENIGDGYRVKEVRGEGSTHYSSYTEPGAKEGSYREILLKLPGGVNGGVRLKPGLSIKQEYNGTWNIWDDKGDGGWVFRKGFGSQEEAMSVASNDPMLTTYGEPAKHKAPHYGDQNENILATARINERTDADGNRVLYIEEIQSDWAQDLRKDTLSPAELAEYKKLQAMQDDFLAGRIGTDQYTSEVSARRDTLEEKANYHTPDEVPRTNNAPFVGKTEQWAGLILKRLMRYAADNGFDKVAWSTGEQQFKRWGSERVSWKSEQVETYNKDRTHAGFDTVFMVAATEQTGGEVDGMNIEEMARQRGELIEQDGKPVESKEDLRKILRNVMHRENNEQQIDAMADKLWARMQNEPEGDFMPRREGMRGFYGDEQGRAPDGKPSWLANALKALPAEIRPKLETIGVKMRQAESGPAAAWNFLDQAIGQPGFTVDKALANTPMPLYSKTAANVVESFKTGSGDRWAKLKPYLLSLQQMNDQYGTKIKSMPAYTRTVGAMEQLQQQITMEAHPIIVKWQSLDAGVRDRLHKLMKEATLSGAHPDVAFDDPLNAHLSDKAKATHDKLRAQYTALPMEAKGIYQQSKGQLQKLWKQRGDFYTALVNHSYAKLIENQPEQKAKLEKKRDKLIADHQAKLKELKGPYFPLLRFGDYIVVGKSKAYLDLETSLDGLEGQEYKDAAAKLAGMKKDAKHYSVWATESLNLANQKMRELQGQGLQVKQPQLAEEHSSALSPVSAYSMQRINTVLNNQLDAGTANKVERLLTELYLTSLPEHSALQRQIKRIGVEGANDNMLRTFARAIQADSFHLSRMKYGTELSSLLFQMEKEAKDAGTEAQHAMRVIKKSLDLDMEYKPHPVLGLIQKFTSFMMLGVSPAYLFTNASQPWMIALPQIAGVHGFNNTLKAMSAAWGDAKNAIVASKKKGAFADIDFNAIKDANERQMLQFIRDNGQVDITINFDTGIAAEDSDPRIARAERVAAWANHHIEVSNRITTALTAYRLESARLKVKGGMTAEDMHKQATEYAYKQVVDTQLDYSNANAAYFMKGQHFSGLNRLIMQFKKYQQGMLYLLAHNAQQAFKGDRQAMASLGYLMAMQVSFAGLAGVPLMFPLLMLVPGGGDDEGDNETRFRNMLTDAFGKDVADAMYKGLPTMLGVDLSKRLGLGELLDPTPFYDIKDIKREKTGKDAVGNLALSLAGPAAGMTSNYFDAGFLGFRDGEWGKAFEKALPKALSDPLKATRYAETGITTRKGNVALEADKLSTWDLWQRGLGFTSAKESNYYEAVQAKEDTKAALEARRSRLITNWANYKLRGDTEAVAEMEQAVKNWNAKHPEKGVRIDRSTLLKSVQQRRKDAAQRNEAGVLLKKNEQHLRDVTRFAAAP